MMSLPALFVLSTLAGLGVGGSVAWAQEDGGVFQVVGVEPDDRLNVRAKPDPGSAIIGTLSPDQRDVRATGKVELGGATQWREIEIGRRVGWVSDRFLQASAVIDGEPVERSGQRVALVVGNGAYGGGLDPYGRATQDGRKVARALRDAGYEVIEVIDGNLVQMRAGLEAFQRQAKNAEVGIVYFVGQGMQAGGANYLLPISARLLQPEDLATQAVPLSSVLGAFMGTQAELCVVVLDAARATPLTAQLNAGASGPLRVADGLAAHPGGPGLLLAYAGAPDWAAPQDASANPFTAAMVQAMQADGEPVRRVLEMAGSAVARQTSGRQTPWIQAIDVGDQQLRPPAAPVYDGRWSHSDFNLMVSPSELRFEGEGGPAVLAPRTCGPAYRRQQQTVSVATLPADLADLELPWWAVPATEIGLLEIECGEDRWVLGVVEPRRGLIARRQGTTWTLREEVVRDR